MTTNYHAHGQARNIAQMLAWTVAWVLTLALASFGPDRLWDSRELISGLAIAVNVAVGIGLIYANARYLEGIDELQRKIQMEALALALGSGLVAGCAYSVVSTTDLIDSDAEIGPLLILMSVVYMAAIAIGNLRYR